MLISPSPGIVSVVLGLLVVVLDYYIPEQISIFFNVDPLIDYEETFVYEGEDENGETPAMVMAPDAPQVRQSISSTTPHNRSVLRLRRDRLKRRFTSHHSLDHHQGSPNLNNSDSSISNLLVTCRLGEEEGSSIPSSTDTDMTIVEL